jgi:Fibronectin type III domain.
MKKRLTIFLALICMSVMGWATQYCHEAMTLSGGATIYLSCTSPSAGNYQIVIEGTNLAGLGGSFFNPGTVDLRNTITTSTSTRIVCDIEAASAPSLYTPLYVLCPGEQNIGWPNDVEWGECAGGDPDPDPDPDPTPEPDPNSYTAGGHTITLDASYVDDIYTLVISSTDNMEGLGGSFWNVNGVGADMRTNSGTSSYTVSGDKKTITCQVQSSSAPNIYTPLYVLMPGEVNFGSVTLNWEDRTPINSEYCNYQGSETHQDDHYFAITFETDASGNVVITIGDGTGAGACSFRNGGFEGGNNGLDNFVVSDDDFATTTPATDYFTVTRPTDGDLQYILTKTADLPANAKIKHLSAGAIAWREAGADRWCFPEFIYTYGGTCNQLDAPTNVSIDANNVITFDAVSGADSYTAYVSLNGVQKYSQVVVSGDELTFVPLVDGAYDVTVVASGSGKTDSDPSAAFVWNLEAVEIVLGNSEYCERIMQTGTNTEAAFTWETDGSGNIVITIAETLGGAADAAHFRGNALALGNFKVGAGQAAGSNYFSHPGTTTSNQLVLTVTNAPALGEKIYYHGTVEYATSLDGNAWPTLDFEWTYGTVCSGKAVSAIVNNNTMGSAVVKVGEDEVTSVDEGTEVTFIATSADPALYRFVNWTKGGVEVSTSATYAVTITETTNLVANFDYIRETYCHAEINSVQNKKLYLTLGSIGGGQYQIKIEGSEEAQLTALTNANYTINWVTTTIEDGDKKMSGQDVPFNNARWAFDASGYGSATAVFGISEGKTWEDIHVWNHAIYFNSPNGEIGYTGFPDRYHIDWEATCIDPEAPVIAKAEAEVLNESSVRLTIQATDNWEGILTYTISRAGADDIVSNHASGEEFTQDVDGLTAGTEYTFTVTVSDGVNDASQNIVVTPIADNVKPVMGEASLESKTWNSAIINVAATDNKGVAAYYVVEKDADYVATEGKITIEGLTAATAYTFNIKAKDAAGNISDNSAEVVFTTDAHSLVPATAAPVPPAREDRWVRPIYSDAYTSILEHDFALSNWGSKAGTREQVADDNYLLYDFSEGGNAIVWGENNAGANAIVAIEGKNAGGDGDNTGVDASAMEYLHVDIWSNASSANVEVRINDNMLARVNLTGSGWQQFDLPLSEHVENINPTSVRWMKFTNISDADHIAIDNAYFWREPVAADESAPSNVRATAIYTDLYSVLIELSATENNDDISYSIKLGDVVKAVGVGKSDVAATIRVAGLTPNTNYTFAVVATDVSDNSAAPVNVTVRTKALPAPAPAPVIREASVRALYSNAYTPVCTVTNYCENWWQAATLHNDITLGENDNVLYYDNIPASSAFGWSFALPKIDAAGFQKLHFDIYPMKSGTIELYPVKEAGGEYPRASQTLVAETWNEVVLDFTNETIEDIFKQLGFRNYSNLGAFFIDNVYFFKTEEATLDQDATTPDALNALNGAIANVEISRTLLANGNFKTLCLPFSMNAEQIAETFGDCEILMLTGGRMKTETDIYVQYSPVNEIVAGKPYLMTVQSDVTGLNFDAVVINSSTDNNEVEVDLGDGKSISMLGTFVKKSLTDDGLYYLDTDGYLHSVSAYGEENGGAAVTIPAFRCYYQFNGFGGNNAPIRARVVRTTDVVTDCEDIVNAPVAIKQLRDRQLFILRDGNRYTVTGLRVE